MSLDLVEIDGIGELSLYIPSSFILWGLYLLVVRRFKQVSGPIVLIFMATVVQLLVLDVHMWAYVWPIAIILVGITVILVGIDDHGSGEKEASLVRDRPDNIILSPGQPTRPESGWFPFRFGKRKRERASLTVGPYQVGIIIWDGAVLDIFSEGTQVIPEGEVQTYVVSTAPFNLTFRLKAPGRSSYQYDIVLDPPLLTSDEQHLTGRIDLTMSVIAQGSRFTSVLPERADRLLQLLGLSGDVVTKSDIARLIKGELSPKFLALDLRGYTAEELRNNQEPLRDISSLLKTELASAIDRFGLQLDDFYINWAPQPQETASIKQPEPDSRIQDSKSGRGSRSPVPTKSTPEQTRTQDSKSRRESRPSQTRRQSVSKRTTNKSTVHTSVMQQLEDSGLFDDGKLQKNGSVSFQVKGKYAATIYVTKNEREIQIRDGALQKNRFPNNKRLYEFVGSRAHGTARSKGNSAYAYRLNHEHIAKVIEVIRSGL